MIRLLVADDQALVRMGVRVLVEGEDDILLVGEATDGEQALELTRAHHPDVVLMDIRMPVRDGIDALREIVADPRLTGTRVVMLTTFELDEYVFDSLAAGASGFLVKDGETAELLHAVRVVAEGESLLSPSVTRRVIAEFATAPRHRADPHPGIRTLTEREAEVAGLVAEGMSNTEIADRLFLSPATVRTHVGRAMLKLEARDRAQLVVFAVRSGLTR
ncbi:response regulator [Qaidamihabitans albus]|uniref:response regulator n=1 Tax=Qaidamihabitans albus TaxID=2795733 RepID=UPI0018F24A30|nr:response regulator transcription factor [Qaidamihabitans albus]